MLSDKKKTLIAYTQLFLAGMLLGTAGVIAFQLSGEVSPLSSSGGRAAFALPTVWLLTLLFWFIKGEKAPQLLVSASKWQWTVALCRGLNTICFLAALEFNSTATGFMLCNMTPVYILGWQYICDRKLPTFPQFVCAAIVALGSWLYFSADPQHFTAIGLTAGIFGGVTFAGFFFGMGKVAKSPGPQYLSSSVMLGDLLTIPIVLFSMFALYLFAPADTEFIQWSRLWLPLKWPSLYAVGLVVLLGVFQSGLSGWLLTRGQGAKRQSGEPVVDPLFMAFLPTAIMVWAPFLTWKTMGESFFNLDTALGFVIVHLGILAAAIVNQRSGKR